MSAAWVPPGKQTFVDLNGKPLNGGYLHHYVPGSSVRKDTWQDYGQEVFNTNPIILNERGQAIIWGNGAYRQVLTDSAGNEIWDRNTTVGVQGDVVLAAGSIFGLTISNGSAISTTQINVAVGQCRDSTNSVDLRLVAPLLKDITAVWAPGSGVGGRDSATALAAGQSYHVFLIFNPGNLNTDVLFSQSATNPILPGGYTQFRRLGALPRIGGATSPPSGTGIPLFVQKGNQFLLNIPNNEFVAQTGSTAPLLRDFLVPLGISVNGIFYGQMNLDPNTGVRWRATDPDNGVPPSINGVTHFAQMVIDATDPADAAVFYMTTNTTGQLWIQCSSASALWACKSTGWYDDRGQLG